MKVTKQWPRLISPDGPLVCFVIRVFVVQKKKGPASDFIWKPTPGRKPSSRRLFHTEIHRERSLLSGGGSRPLRGRLMDREEARGRMAVVPSSHSSACFLSIHARA